MAIPAFIVPFFFVQSPALLMNGSLPEIIYGVLSASIGVWMFSAATINYLGGKLPLWGRGVIIAGAVCLIGNHLIFNILGYVILAVMIIFWYRRHIRNTVPPNREMKIA